jgi:hypothetical protein
MFSAVIARSEATKQSTPPLVATWIASLALAMTTAPDCAALHPGYNIVLK